jgi:hypothetical protein
MLIIIAGSPFLEFLQHLFNALITLFGGLAPQ